ncbi:MAG: YdcF family protein [Clostridia bacterium]|nr:YdcF family protein [Clostridia bacterium]NCC44425.1 YdcF family protein [Clostridia bacterium]
MLKNGRIELYQSFFDNFTEFIFLEDQPQKADIIFVPGNGYPQMAENAANLWHLGYAPMILPSGKYSVITGKFSGVQAHKERYQGEYETEWEFLKEVLRQNGVPSAAILKEDEATYTYQNAILSREVTDRAGIEIHRAIICCKAQHARRCRMYYQLLYPKAKLLICPSDVGINRENWMLTKKGREEVLGEMERCGAQFHEILADIAADSAEK